jgi:hypothetical protein
MPKDKMIDDKIIYNYPAKHRLKPTKEKTISPTKSELPRKSTLKFRGSSIFVGEKFALFVKNFAVQNLSVLTQLGVCSPGFNSFARNGFAF